MRRKGGMFGCAAAYGNSMKKSFLSLILLCGLMPVLSACGGGDDTAYLSEARSDLFCAETEAFSLALACVSREYPYIADGIPCEMSDLVEITLEDRQDAEDYRVFVLGEREYGGEMSYRSIRDDYFYSQGVDVFPQGSVSLRVEWEGGSCEVAATSVKTADTLSVKDALKKAEEAVPEQMKALRQDGRLNAEFYVRLLKRDKPYYYVGITDRDGNTLSLLLDGATGEVLARRDPK